MNKNCLSMAIILIISLAIASPAWANTSEWAQEDIRKALDKALIPESLQAGDFTRPITREQFCELLVTFYMSNNKQGFDLPLSSIPFVDTQSEAVAAAYGMGIIKGVNDTHFLPDQHLTRQETATLIYRFTEMLDVTLLKKSGDVLPASDARDIAPWAARAVDIMRMNALMKGNGAAFQPNASCNVEQAVIIMLRLSEKGFVVTATQPPFIHELPEETANQTLPPLLDAVPPEDSIVVPLPDPTPTPESAPPIPPPDPSPTPAAISPISGPAVNSSEYCLKYFGSAERTGFESKEEAEGYMTEVKVEVWSIGIDGSKKPSHKYLTVHKEAAEDVAAIFKDIFDGDEKFPIKNVGGFSWRTGEHSKGLAIDINYEENYYFHPTTGRQVGNYWKPGGDVYSIPRDGDVVRAFKKRGWGWGGDWRNSVDYMHFSLAGV